MRRETIKLKMKPHLANGFLKKSNTITNLNDSTETNFKVITDTTEVSSIFFWNGFKAIQHGREKHWPNISSSNGGPASFYEAQLKRQNTHKTERLGIPQDSRLAAAVMEANGDGGRPCTCEMHYSWPNLRLINVAWESPINEPHDNHVKRGRKLVKTESRTWQVPGRERERERDGGRIHNGSFDAGAKC